MEILSIRSKSRRNIEQQKINLFKKKKKKKMENKKLKN